MVCGVTCKKRVAGGFPLSQSKYAPYEMAKCCPNWESNQFPMILTPVHYHFSHMRMTDADTQDKCTGMLKSYPPLHSRDTNSMTGRKPRIPIDLFLP